MAEDIFMGHMKIAGALFDGMGVASISIFRDIAMSSRMERTGH